MDILKKYSKEIKGILSTFDRMIYKGYITPFFIKENRKYYLWEEQVLFKDFGKHAEKLTKNIKENAKRIALEAGRPYVYLDSPKISKEKMAQKIMDEEGIEEGLICILSTVELCKTFKVRKNIETGKLELVDSNRKCLYHYFYYNDKEFGFMHVRLQSWFPFEIQIYLNGREYLSRKLDKEGIDYTRYDNSFIDIDDLDKAQRLAGKIEFKKWGRSFDKIAKRINPELKRITEIFNTGYYWCLDQCEYATDVMFESRDHLEKIYRDLVKHALVNFKSEDVMTFLGRKLHGNFKGEIVSDIKKRPQGVRIKHRMKKNSIKMYDKWSILRIETTINQPREFKIYRTVERKGQKVKIWVPMGKGISNVYRFAQVSRAANNRYLNALVVLESNLKNVRELEKISQPITKNNRRYSGMNLMTKKKTDIFISILNGSNMINGFRNKDIRSQIYPKVPKGDEKKYSVKVTHILLQLRVHGLIAKIKGSFRYIVTKKGYRIMSSILLLKNKNFPELVLSV